MPSANEQHAPAVIGLGQCSLDHLGFVDRYPEVDQKAELSQLLVQGGGPVATALVTLSRLGVRTAFVGRVGADPFGEQIAEGLESEGVDCRFLSVDPEGSSQIAFIAVERGSGRRNIFWSRGSARPLSPGELAQDFLGRARILHLDGLQEEASLAAARMARKQGVTTVLDGGSVRSRTRELLSYVDHLVVSQKFATQMGAGSSLEKTMEALLAYGAAAVTVTRGEKGSLTWTREGDRFAQSAFDLRAVDTTGCGDVFHGGYIYGLIQGWDLRRSVRFAAACAALKTRALGGRTAIPRLPEVWALLEEH